MNTKLGLILAGMIVAAEAATTAGAAPGAGTNQPPARAGRAGAARPTGTAARRSGRATAETPPTPPLVVNETAAVKQMAGTVNVRAQARINSEIVTRLTPGEIVTVLEEVTIRRPQANEPAKWARVSLPTNAHLWVNSSFLDTSSTVVPAKLNMRSGAGENFTVMGVLKKGDTVKAVGTKGDWTEIMAPTNSSAFIAAHLLEPRGPAIPVPATTTNIVAETTPAVVTPVIETPVVKPVATTNETPAIPVAVPAVPVPAPPVDEPLPPRIVQREGIVGDTVSIQAPTYFQLESLDTGKPIDYLYTTATNLIVSRYKGMTVLVTGEESLDERWPNTPVITIQKIQVVK